MKAEIKRDGILYISPDTELEAYALLKWSEGKRLKENIVVNTNSPTPNQLLRGDG